MLLGKWSLNYVLEYKEGLRTLSPGTPLGQVGAPQPSLFCLQTATLYPGVVFGICFVLNCFIWGKHSSGAVSALPVREGQLCSTPLPQVTSCCSLPFSESPKFCSQPRGWGWGGVSLSPAHPSFFALAFLCTLRQLAKAHFSIGRFPQSRGQRGNFPLSQPRESCLVWIY